MIAAQISFCYIRCMDAQQIIRALGGPVAVARSLGMKPSAVSNWYTNGIPGKVWPALARRAVTIAAEAERVTLAELEQHTVRMDDQAA